MFASVGKIVDRSFEPLVLERSDSSAALADEVMVVLATRNNRFIHAHPVSEIRLLYQPETLQSLEGPIDACHADRFAIAAQGVVYLLS